MSTLLFEWGEEGLWESVLHRREVDTPPIPPPPTPPPPFLTFYQQDSLCLGSLFSIWERLFLNPYCLAYSLTWRQLCKCSCQWPTWPSSPTMWAHLFFLTYDWTLKSQTVSHWARCYVHLGCFTNLATEVKEEISILGGQDLNPAANGGWQQRKICNGEI